MIKKHMPVLVVCLLIVLVSLIGGAVYGINKLIPTSKQMDLTEYYGQNADGEASLVAGTQKLEQKALISGDEVYIPLDVVNGYLNQRYYWDSANKKILYATPTSLTEEAASDQPGGNVWLKESTVYLKLDYVKKYTDIDSYIYKDPARIAIQYKFSNVQTVTVKKDTVIRYRGGIKSKILTKTAKDTVLRLMNEGEDWDQVATDDGYIGYIQKKKVSAADTTDYKRSFKAEAYSYFTMDEPVNLAWHQVTSTDANNYFADTTQNMTGVNVISPTWYFLQNNEGDIESFADASYVEAAHAKGMQVWALISNFSEDVNTSTLLASRAARQKVQNYLVSQAQELGFDGINIDFEGIAQEAGYAYVQFMRELSILCRKSGIVLSVDVPVPMDFSKHYNRKELGTVCDYVIMMGYDEHYAGSDLVGSVASMEFERTGIENSLTEVSKEKLISAIPFYTRLWYTQTAEDGSTSVTSEALGMESAQQKLTENGVTSTYDEATEQQYAEWTDAEGRFCQVWLEDQDSVTKRASLVKEYELGGIAEWVLGNQQDWVWEIISANIA